MELKVDCYRDRIVIVTALVNAGYLVSVEERPGHYSFNTSYYIIIKKGREVKK